MSLYFTLYFVIRAIEKTENQPYSAPKLIALGFVLGVMMAVIAFVLVLKYII